MEDFDVQILHLILFLVAKLDIALEWIAQSRYKVSIQRMINRCWRVIPLGQHWVLLGLLDFLVGLFFFQGNSIALYFLSLNFVFLVRPLNVRSITSMTFWVHNTSVLSIDTMFHCGSRALFIFLNQNFIPSVNELISQPLDTSRRELDCFIHMLLVGSGSCLSFCD